MRSNAPQICLGHRGAGGECGEAVENKRCVCMAKLKEAAALWGCAFVPHLEPRPQNMHHYKAGVHILAGMKRENWPFALSAGRPCAIFPFPTMRIFHLHKTLGE